jgi:hypothetical protein
MKNPFVVSSLILTAAYPSVVVLSLLGLLPLPVPSLFEFVGIYTSLGVLASAFGEYGRDARAASHDRQPLVPQNAPIPFVPAAQPHASAHPTQLKAA